MLRLLRQKLDALADPLDPGFGFDLIRLEALLAEETKPVTVSFDSNENARRQIAFLVDRLAARFGEHRVQRFVPQDTHIPEAAGVAVPAQDRDFTSDDAWTLKRQAGDPPRRPLRLLEKPEEVIVRGCVRAGRAAQPFPLAAMPFMMWRAPKAPNASPWNGGSKARADARLFPGRDQGRPALLALSRRPVSPERLRRAGICKASSHELRRTGRHHQFLLPARRLASRASSSSRRPNWAMPPSASPTATPWPAWCAPMKPGSKLDATTAHAC